MQILDLTTNLLHEDGPGNLNLYFNTERLAHEKKYNAMIKNTSSICVMLEKIT